MLRGTRSYFGLPKLTDRYWDPMWASAQEKGCPVNFHIASGDVDLFDDGIRDNGAARQLRGMGVPFFMANVQGDRQARSPAASATASPTSSSCRSRAASGGSRSPSRPRLAVAELRRAQGAPRVRPPAERVLQAARSTAASGSRGRHRGRDRPDRRRQHPVRDRLPAPDQHVARTGELPQRPDEYLREVFGDLDVDSMRKILHDNAARDLPPRLSSGRRTQWSGESGATRAASWARPRVGRRPSRVPRNHNSIGMPACSSWCAGHLADEVGARRIVEVDEHHRVRRRVRRMHLVGHDRPGVQRGVAGDRLPASVPAPQWRQYMRGTCRTASQSLHCRTTSSPLAAARRSHRCRGRRQRVAGGGRVVVISVSPSSGSGRCPEAAVSM